MGSVKSAETKTGLVSLNTKPVVDAISQPNVLRHHVLPAILST
jgi:hypothetical protein